METIVYFIRHSVRLNNKNVIHEYNTSQSNNLKMEKIVLSVTGEKRAEILSNEKELQNIDVVYTSNCVRTLQTAKYLLEKQNLMVNIDERLDERRVGISNSDIYPDWFTRQYLHKDYKTEGGESQIDVVRRMTEAFNEIIDKHKGKRIAIFSHGIAITFFLLNFCKLENISQDKVMTYSFKGKQIFSKKINSPDVFKLTLNDENEVINVENIEFDDLEYDDFDVTKT